MSQSLIHSMFSVIQKMIHRTRTAYGYSDITYGSEVSNDWENYQQDILQGNTAVPDIWSALSSVVFEVLHRREFRCSIITAISKQLLVLVGFSYVDYCDLIQTGSDPVEVLASIEELINSWGSLMEVTGEALRTEKSWFYLVEYV